MARVVGEVGGHTQGKQGRDGGGIEANSGGKCLRENARYQGTRAR